MKSKLSRLAGYFMAAATVFLVLPGPLAVIYQDYHARHSWPVASGRIARLDQLSRLVRTTRGRDYQLYSTKFSVTIDVVPGQCPASMQRMRGGVTECMGVYATPESESLSNARASESRHRPLSSVQVHYDPSGLSNRVFFADESIWMTYPWRQIGGVLLALVLTTIAFLAAAHQSKKADQWESRFPDERPDAQAGELGRDPACST